MFSTKMGRARWKEAQKWEYKGWVSTPQVVENEWKEIVKKYKRYLGELSGRLRIDNTWKILDVGCGSTCISRLFKKGKKYGIDPLAKKLNLDRKVRGVKIINAKGEKIPFDNKFFNLVICRNVIDHTEGPYQVIKEVKRVLKKEEVFVLSCYVYPPFISFLKNVSEFIPQLRNIPHPHTFSPKSLEYLVSKGFKIIEKKVIYTGYHPNDYGKINEEVGEWSVMEKIVLFFNFKVLRCDWFVKELLFVCRRTT